MKSAHSEVVSSSAEARAEAHREIVEEHLNEIIKLGGLLESANAKAEAHLVVVHEHQDEIIRLDGVLEEAIAKAKEPPEVIDEQKRMADLQGRVIDELMLQVSRDAKRRRSWGGSETEKPE